ncbi:leucine-rich repeat domain-containing protein, partial [Listeria sp. FSL L7-0091]|uniref:leucine-rich repeat domain-containing protein n=1 Tax=Listeria farberi TaxID=2713500 RepID=UPI001624B171
LSGLTSLTTLQLNNNAISDISALSGLTSLTTLQLNNNAISDIGSNIDGLSNLHMLSLNDNEISEFSLSGLNNLNYLYLNNNDISSVTLDDLPNLLGLYLSNNQLESNISIQSPLQYGIDLSGNQIRDLSFISSIQIQDHGSIDLSDNQISDVSYLSDFVGRVGLTLDNNYISDLSSWEQRVSSLSENDIYNTNTYIPIYIRNQNVILPEIKWSASLELPVTVKNYNNVVITPSSISDNGQFADDVITWTELSNVNQDVTYSWDQRSAGDNYVFSPLFSGTATTSVTPIGVKILVDDDGDSQTTTDQTLFAEETNDLEYLEDIYNYAKEQLSGTDYGLVDIQPGSNGSYTFIVSKVGSLKTKDVNGDSIGTDKVYVPTYTVTGTGNAAQLDVSYGATIDSAPGYVYIYEKNTPQEVRYVPGANVNVPLTDTNSNGKPQWQEDYTVVQYQRAGGLNPTTPDGSQVPGGTITIPDDSIEGDRITLPDTITGSDGREYGVDPSIDIDPTIPGVQVPLTDDEQDIPYLDVLLSESTSESIALSESESTSSSLSESESSSLSESESSSLSESESSSLSESESISQSTSESISLSESESVSQSESESSSLSESESSSLSESESSSLSESESSSLSESESSSLSESESISQSTSESISLSESESVSQSESESSS